MFDFLSFKNLKHLSVKRPGQEIELQEVFFDRFVQNPTQELEVPLSKGILGTLYGIFLLITILFLSKTFYFQIVAGSTLSAQAESNTIRSFPIRSERGVIYDNFMRQLVFNKPSFDFVCDKRYIPQGRERREKVLRDVADLFGTSLGDLKVAFDGTNQSEILVRENLSRDQLIRAETKTPLLEGCEVRRNTLREYVREGGLSHVLGYTAKISPEELKKGKSYFVTDQIGKTGVEKSYEEVLRGEPGKRFVERDTWGNVIREKGQTPSRSGESLVLWLDLELQQKIQEALQKNLEKIGAKKGVAIAMDPRTGGILSMVSIPEFDNNLFSQGISYEQYQDIVEDPLSPFFNRAIAGLYPTGSIIKPLIGAAALQERIIDSAKSLVTEGFIKVPHRYNPEIVYTFHDWKNHGSVAMRDAIAVSSNAYFYMIGGGFQDQEGLGPSRIKKYLSLFGWGKETSLDLPGEARGLIPDPDWKKKAKGEGWWDGDTYFLSIGQGDLLATPLQVTVAFGAVANGGTLYEPMMAKEIIKNSDVLFREGGGADRQEGKKVLIAPRTIRSDIIDPENLKVIREGMLQAVTRGSAVMLNELPEAVAAKTGTAQTGRKDEEGKDYLYSWVTVFAPYETPEVVLTILIEETKEGSFTVLPVAREVLKWYFTKK